MLQFRHAQVCVAEIEPAVIPSAAAASSPATRAATVLVGEHWMNRGMRLTPFIPAPTVIPCLLAPIQNVPVFSGELPALFEFGSAFNDRLGQATKRFGCKRFTGC